jgi:hypothetical protein
MRKAHRGLGLAATLVLGAGGLLVMVTPTVASAAPTAAPPCTISQAKINNTARSMGIGGVIVAQGTSSTCEDPPPPPEPAFNGTPPLLFNGRQGPADCTFSPCDDGDLMSTRATGPLVIVPIFWAPSGYSFTSSYENIINEYIHDVAAASGQLTNVYSVLTEYYGNNGSVQYRFQAGPSIVATNPFPTTGDCTVSAADTKGIYNDGTGYSACLDDNNLQAEVDAVTASHGLPHNLNHIYELFLPKGVESCFLPGSDATNNECTINNEPTAAYCAYHSTDLNSAVYSNMDYPIYDSPTGFTCGTDARFPTEESPNGNPDADTEISPLSHETSEAVTDPDTETGWYDSTGNEIGDDCAYIFGATGGTPGALYNQTINGQHFITQEEFSNRVFARSGGHIGCVQSWLQEFPGA